MMKVVLTVIHSLAMVIGLFLSFNQSITVNIDEFLLYFIFGYSIGVIGFSVFAEIFRFSFPRHFGLFLVVSFFVFQFFSGKYLLFDKGQILDFFSFLAVFIAFTSLIILKLDAKIKTPNKTFDFSAYRNFFWTNNLFYIFLLAGFFAVTFFYWNADVLAHSAHYTAILLGIFPFFNKRFLRHIALVLEKSNKFSAIGIDFGKLGRLSKIKNFVFFKDKVISSGVYQLLESDYRSTVRVSTALQLAHTLSSEWNQKYTRLFVNDQFEKVNWNFRVVEKNENGISVIDDDANMYHFGNSWFVKDKIKKDERANLFLLRNEIPIAKFKINEKINADKVEVLNQISSNGNLLLIFSGHEEDLGYDYTILFDKIYSGANDSKQAELLKQLQQKAPTALFSAKDTKQFTNSLCFYFTSNTSVQHVDNKVIVSYQDLNLIPGMIELAMKTRKYLRFSLLVAIVIQVVMGMLAWFFYLNPVFLVGVNLFVFLLSEIIAFGIARKLDHFPSHPANLAQSHQAA